MSTGYVAIYLRLSDDDRDIGLEKIESSSIQNQRAVVLHFLRQQDELSAYQVKEFLDDGYSGVNFARPGVQRLLREVQENKVYAIVVKDLSRFGRNYIETGHYIEQVFPRLGVRFLSVSERYDSFCSRGELEIGFQNLMHDLYSRDLSKKIKSVKELQQRKGIHSGGDVPYGYQRMEEGRGRYQPDPAAAEIVKKIFALALQGQSPGQIAVYLNRQGIGTPGTYKNQTQGQNYRLENRKSNLWTPAQVREIIENKVYIGMFVCRKTTSLRPRQTVRNAPETYIIHENDHEKLISERDFAAAQKAVQKQGKRKRYCKDLHPHALRGKVKCGQCGYSMSLWGKNDHRGYHCRMGESCGSHLQVNVQRLEEVLMEVTAYLAELETGMESAVWRKKWNQEMADLLVMRIDVYDLDKIEIQYHFSDVYLRVLSFDDTS